MLTPTDRATLCSIVNSACAYDHRRGFDHPRSLPRRTEVPLNNQAVTQIEPIRIPRLAWLAATAATIGLYLVLNENGAVLIQSWETLHELFHDGRHLFGAPCH